MAPVFRPHVARSMREAISLRKGICKSKAAEQRAALLANRMARSAAHTPMVKIYSSARMANGNPLVLRSPAGNPSIGWEAQRIQDCLWPLHAFSHRVKYGQGRVSGTMPVMRGEFWQIDGAEQVWLMSFDD